MTTIIDPQILSSFRDDLGDETCKVLYQAFDEELAEGQEQLAAAINDELNKPLALETLHKLKGTAATYGANLLAESSEKVEILIEGKAPLEEIRKALA